MLLIFMRWMYYLTVLGTLISKGSSWKVVGNYFQLGGNIFILIPYLLRFGVNSIYTLEIKVYFHCKCKAS